MRLHLRRLLKVRSKGRLIFLTGAFLFVVITILTTDSTQTLLRIQIRESPDTLKFLSDANKLSGILPVHDLRNKNNVNELNSINIKNTTETEFINSEKQNTLSVKGHLITDLTTNEIKNNNITESIPHQTIKDDIINPHDFKYIFNNNFICNQFTNGKKNKLFLFTFIHSKPDHFKHRAVVRTTWGSFSLFKKLQTILVFVLGKSSNKSVQTMIQLEQERYQDIIQEDFLDSYRNMTYKVIAGFKWITNHCQEASLILKADDDMLINIFNLIRYLKYYLKTEKNPRKIMCLSYSGAKPDRKPKSKWFITKEEYSANTYPVYCSGSAYIIPTTIVPRLYNASLYTKFFWVDDVYASGLLPEAIDVTHITLKSGYVFNNNYYSRMVEKHAIFAHMTGNDGVDNRYHCWKKILQKELLDFN